MRTEDNKLILVSNDTQPSVDLPEINPNQQDVQNLENIPQRTTANRTEWTKTQQCDSLGHCKTIYSK